MQYLLLLVSYVLLLLIRVNTSCAFVVSQAKQYHPSQSQQQRSSLVLNLFGGGGNNKDGNTNSNKQPGMMDQLAMFKKAQDIASKKKKLDEELQTMSFIGTSSNEQVMVTMKYIPVTNPMDPNPEYESIQFTFPNDDYYNTVSSTDLSNDIKNAITDGIDKTNKMVAEKYTTLQSDLMEALGGKLPGF